jgi:hypothetical protein
LVRTGKNSCRRPAEIVDVNHSGANPRLDSTQRSALVALVSGPPPEGSARWSVWLLTEQAIKRGVVDKVGRETVRLVLAEHELKPWREKNGSPNTRVGA